MAKSTTATFKKVEVDKMYLLFINRLIIAAPNYYWLHIVWV